VPDALDDMVREAQKETAGAAFGGVLFKEQGKKRWTQVHAWRCASRLARAPYGIAVGGVPQKEMLFDVFKGDKDALKAMVNANLLAIESRVVVQGGSSTSAAAASSSTSAASTSTSTAPAPNGAEKKVVQYCVPVSPLQHAAYQRIVGDAAFAARMRQHCAEADAAELNEKIAAVELELLRLEQGRARGAGAELRGAMLDAELATLTRALQAQKEGEQL
jgi:hypothetical protein